MRKELQVSIAPIREALQVLAAEGLAAIQLRRDVYVSNVSLLDINDLYFTRSLIEGEPIFCAVPHLSANNRESVHGLISEMHYATDTKNIETYIVLSRPFHLLIYSALGTQHLLQVINTLWKRGEHYRFRYMFVTQDADRSHQEHEAILAACQKSGQELAEQLAALHNTFTQDILREQLNKIPNRCRD